MKRYTLTLGATASVGGKVVAASSHGSINGVGIALGRDAIDRPVCKTTDKFARIVILCEAAERFYTLLQCRERAAIVGAIANVAEGSVAW